MSGIWLGSNIWAWRIADASSELTSVLRFIEPLVYDFKATLLQQAVGLWIEGEPFQAAYQHYR